MRFIDEAEILIKSGDGGKGCVSFRREKYVPRGGPNGGDGGCGGDIIIFASHAMTTLLDYKYKRHYFAASGKMGRGKNQTGKDGKDLEIPVPLGTVVKDAMSGEILADLIENNQRIIVAQGGRGGRGNTFFKSSTLQTPRFAQSGEPGEEKKIFLELKLIADVALVGFPNTGKSTLISKISAARPKIADYPFTTLTPHLGVVRYKNFNDFVIADCPGLIKGAHQGKGLGIKFLKHLERVYLLVHLLDPSPFEKQRDPLKDFEIINQELKSHHFDLSQKKQIVVLNKIDIFKDKREQKKIKLYFQKKKLPFFAISAITGEGLAPLLNNLGEILSKIKNKYE